MASAAPEIYETSLAQEIALRLDGIHRLGAGEAGSEEFLVDHANLARAATEPNPFFEPWFLLPAIRQFDIGRRVELAAYYRRGELCGLLPLIRTSSYYGYPVPHLAIWLHPNAFSGVPLIRRGHEQGFWHALLEMLDDQPGGALFLHLPSLHAQGPVCEALDAIVARDQRTAGTVQRHERALLQSTLSPDAYFEASLTTRKRKELRRQHRRLSEEGDVTFLRENGSAGLDRWIAEFLALEAGGWKGTEGSALACDPRTAQMFSAALDGAAQAGMLERLSLRIDGRPIAMLVNFLVPPGAFAFKTAFDENYARFSPGVLLQQENLALLEREGIAWCDSCAAPGHPMIDHFWRERRTIVSRNIGIGGGLRRRLFEQLLRTETKGESLR